MTEDERQCKEQSSENTIDPHLSLLESIFCMLRIFLLL